MFLDRRAQQVVGRVASREIDGDHPVGPGRARSVTRCDTVVTRPSRFVVVPDFSANAAAASTTSASCDRLRRVRVDRDHAPSARDRPSGEVGVGAVVERVGSEQDQDVDLAVGARPQCGQTVAIGFVRRETDLQGADDVAAAQRREDRASARRRAAAVPMPPRRARHREVRPAGDDHDVAGGELLGNRRVGQAFAIGGTHAGPWRTLFQAYLVSPESFDENSMIRASSRTPLASGGTGPAVPL